MVKKRETKPKGAIKWIKAHKLIVISTTIILSLIFITLGAKIKLYADFLLGNDIVVKLDVDKKEISLVHGEEEEITFEVKATTNPFCKALCRSFFSDISNYEVIEQDEFTLKPSIPLKKRYTLLPPDKGTGVAIYRFDMECSSVKTVICHTNEEPSTRSILVTVSYGLNEEEKKLKESLEGQLEDLKMRLSNLEGRQSVFENTSEGLKEALIFEDNTNLTKIRLDELHREMHKLREIWEKQDYNLLAEYVGKAENEFQKTENSFIDMDKSMSYLASYYNGVIDLLGNAKESIEELRNSAVIDNTAAIAVNGTINDFNRLLRILQQKTTIDEKEALVNNITAKIKTTIASTKEQERKDSLKLEIEADINYDSLCEITGKCVHHLSVEERADQQNFNLSKTCENIRGLRELLLSLNESARMDFIEQVYPDTNEFWEDIRLKIANIKQGIAVDYLDLLPENRNNTRLIKEILSESPLFETGEYAEYNLTTALTAELVSQQPVSCSILNDGLSLVREAEFRHINIAKAMPVFVDIEFEEPEPACCVFGKCEECCVTEDCKNDPSKFPVVFLHGHAIDKGTSAEYSLEGFNKIQKKLEEDGYLNAGTVTLYTAVATKPEAEGMLPVPLTIRASYYFDIFRQPENYIVVQTKSENIDTYSIRLKELIDAVKHKTDKPKVNIIAFSMGGLVARRYVQVFGDGSVDKLILIGSPNKGIAGDVANYCPVTGEKLECEDMNSESLFINKLNSELPKIPIYNIIGTGCSMKNGFGDGVVLEKNARLKGAHNYIINGTCLSKVQPLHLKMRDIDLYPEVYWVIKGVLKE